MVISQSRSSTFLLIVLLLAFYSTSSFAQISISSAQLSPSLIGPSTLFHTTLWNAGQPTRFWLEGEIKDQSGRTGLTFVTDKRTLGTGSNLVSASDMVMRTFDYAPNDLGSALRSFQRMPNGSYRFCIRVRTEGEGDDEYCDTYEVDDLIMLDLIHPWDRDTIDEVRPTLTWTMTSSSPSGSNVRLVLTTMEKGKTPAQALGAGIPLFMVPDVKVGPVPYPATLPDLDRGKCYAWQVEEFTGNRVRERSAPWGFCVRDPQVPSPLKYVRIEDISPGTIYRVVDETVYLRYDEAYSANHLMGWIESSDGKRIDIKPENDGTLENGQPNSKSVGVNLYEVDLSGLNLRAGVYILKVVNEKNRVFELKIQVP